MPKFTFKTVKPIGRWKSFENDQFLIKLNKCEVGYFSTQDAFQNGPFKIHLMILKNEEDLKKNPSSDWKWIILKKEFETLDLAKSFLNDNFDAINKLNLKLLCQ